MTNNHLFYNINSFDTPSHYENLGLYDRLNTNFLLTEREGRTGEYWPEVVAVRTERQYSPVRLKLARLVSSLLYGFLITFCPCFCKPVIGSWALRENNALQFSHN